MTVTINGTTGVSLCDTNSVPTAALQANAVTQPKVGTGVAGSGPAFSYYQSVAQSLTTSVTTKLTFTSSEFDTTSGMYASSRFTPTVAGYYQINGLFQVATTATALILYIYKNGTIFKYGPIANSSGSTSVSALVYCNGSTDYIELYGNQSAATQNTVAQTYATWFQGALVRAA